MSESSGRLIGLASYNAIRWIYNAVSTRPEGMGSIDYEIMLDEIQGEIESHEELFFNGLFVGGKPC